MYGLEQSVRIDDQDIDFSIPQDALQPRRELHGQPHGPFDTTRTLDQQVDVAAMQIITHARTEQSNPRVAARQLSSGSDDGLSLLVVQTHGE